MTGGSIKIADDSGDGEQGLAGLVARMAAGEEQALSIFYDQTLGRVYGLALRISGQDQTAEDMTAEFISRPGVRQVATASPAARR